MPRGRSLHDDVGCASAVGRTSDKDNRRGKEAPPPPLVLCVRTTTVPRTRPQVAATPRGNKRAKLLAEAAGRRAAKNMGAVAALLIRIEVAAAAPLIRIEAALSPPWPSSSVSAVSPSSTGRDGGLCLRPPPSPPQAQIQSPVKTPCDLV